MIRKQLYLTPQIDRKLEIVARQEGKSVAEIVRNILERTLKVKKREEAPAEVLLRIAAKAGRGPGDLSTNLTSYLYGDKSPNYGRHRKTIRRR